MEEETCALVWGLRTVPFLAQWKPLWASKAHLSDKLAEDSPLEGGNALCKFVRSPGRAGQRARCPQMTGCYGPVCVQDHLTEGPAHTGELQTPLALLCKRKDTQAH